MRALPPGVTPDFKALVDAILDYGHTCQTALVAVKKRIEKTPPGAGRDNLIAFQKQLEDKISEAQTK